MILNFLKRYSLYIYILIILAIFLFLWFHKEDNICLSDLESLENNICESEPENNTFESDLKDTNDSKFISKGEKICCKTLETIYGVPFKSARPEWLINPETGRRLQLDCYNDKIKIAIEYNGEQHYKWPNFTGQTYEQFINQVRRDMLKAELCERNGVYLITVPYSVPYDEIPSFIAQRLPNFKFQDKQHKLEDYTPNLEID